MKILYRIILTFFFLPISLFSQEFNSAHLDSFIVKAFETSHPTGFAIGVIKNGQVVFEKAYGTKNTSTGDPVTTESLFGIASCSKAFTAAAIGLLVEEGKIGWEDRVIDHLPYFRLHDPYVTREMRIIDLLCHRSGLATFDGDLLWYGTDYSREEILHRIASLPLKHSFRMKYGYSNLMYIAAGEVIKAVSGKTWDEFITERFFKPLGMNSSTTTNRGFEKRNDVAVPHLEGIPQNYINYDNSGAAASINSNVKDLLKWAGMWINGGKDGDKEILSPGLITKLIAPQTVLGSPNNPKPFGTHLRNYALGWSVFDYNGRLVVRHDGGLPGYLSRVILLPEENAAFVLLNNDMSWINYAVSEKLINMITGKESENVIENMTGRYEKYKLMEEKQKETRINSRIPDTSPSLTLEEYAGSYEDAMYGTTLVELKEGKLYVEMLPTKSMFYGVMEHWHYNTFKVEFDDPFLPFALVTFEFDAKGKVSGFKIDLPNNDFHFYNLDFIRKE